MTGAPVLPAAVVGALQQALQAEHAAIFGYAALGPLLSKTGRGPARTDEAAHRGRRNTVLTMLAAAGAVPAASAASYPGPEPLTSLAVAHRCAVELESACCRQWRYVVAVAAATNPTARAPGASTGTGSPGAVEIFAVQALTACAVRAMRWRALLTPSTPTTAFPGI